MEQQNNNKSLIAVLIIIIVILSVLCILFATNTISFNSSSASNDNNQSNGDVVDSNIDLYKLDAIYNTLGIDKNETQSLNHCLNYNLSSNNYLENSKKIFSLYVMINNYNIYDIPLDEQQKVTYCDVFKSDDCSSPQAFLSAAAARVISKPTANRVISKYKLQDTDFLMDFPHVSNIADDLYGYYTDYASGGNCNYIVKHSLNIKENEAQDVTVVDKQAVIELKYDQEKYQYIHENEINQVVTYVLKKAENSYNLDSVSVK